MAINPRQIYPNDTRPSVAIGIGLPFNKPAVFGSTYLTKDAIKTNLINFFLTNQYERYLNNKFGANLRAFIFEQITNDNISFLKEDIQQKLNQNFSNISINELTVNQFPDSNTLQVIMVYSILNTNIVDQIEITF